MENSIEIWKDCKGYEGIYQVSSFGKVKSLAKNIIMSQQKGVNGYYSVSLTKFKKSISKSVHQLVALAFLNHIPSGLNLVVDHINGNKLNNNLKNLQIVSIRFNSIKDKKPKSGYSCVYLNSGSYLVRMRVNGIKKTLGNFKNIFDAVNFRDEFLKDELIAKKLKYDILIKESK